MIFRKPKFWDYKKPNLLAYIFLPLTILFILNNFFLNLKTKKKNQRIKTICIGNIYLGGTGKTPTTIKLYEIIKKFNLNVSVGKKFYKSHFDEIKILNDNTNLITADTRVNILNKSLKNDDNVLIFDDGLQDKNLNYDLQLVCFDSKNWIGNGFLIPSGPLREKIDSLKKYDVVFLKDANLDKNKIFNIIKKNNPKIKIFETYYKAVNLKDFNITKNYLIFSGIGNPDNFKDILLKNKFNISEEIIYPDHYKYNKRDINFIKKKAQNMNLDIITTEKDYSKISMLDNKNINFLKVKLMIKEETNFIKFLKSIIYE